MADNVAAPRARCLCLDIETSRGSRLELRELGVYRPDLDVRERLSGRAADLTAHVDFQALAEAFRGAGCDVSAMTPQGGATWATNLPGQASPSQVSYWISATDDLGNLLWI